MIHVLKLISGEELVGDVTFNGESVTIKRPCVLQMVPSRANPEQPMMALIPYALYVKNHTIEVSTKMVVWNTEPVDVLYNQYNQIFGTGIQIAGA